MAIPTYLFRLLKPWVISSLNFGRRKEKRKQALEAAAASLSFFFTFLTPKSNLSFCIYYLDSSHFILNTSKAIEKKKHWEFCCNILNSFSLCSILNWYLRVWFFLGLVKNWPTKPPQGKHWTLRLSLCGAYHYHQMFFLLVFEVHLSPSVGLLIYHLNYNCVSHKLFGWIVQREDMSGIIDVLYRNFTK